MHAGKRWACRVVPPCSIADMPGWGWLCKSDRHKDKKKRHLKGMDWREVLLLYLPLARVFLWR